VVPPPDGHRLLKRLLLVDDEPELLDILCEHFQRRYELSTALDGAVALERFEHEAPDAVFMDVNMPGASGVEILKLFRQSDPGVPVIMMTANEQVAVAEECLKSGAFAYVPKPFKLAYMDHMAALAVDWRLRRAAHRRPA